MSHDQTVVLHKYCSETNTIEGINVGKGHARSVDCVSVDPTKQYVATGSFDTNLKIWSANLTNIDEAIEEDGDDDDEVWITPGNLKAKRLEMLGANCVAEEEDRNCKIFVILILQQFFCSSHMRPICHGFLKCYRASQQVRSGLLLYQSAFWILVFRKFH